VPPSPNGPVPESAPLTPRTPAPELTSLAPEYREEWHGTYFAILKRAIDDQPDIRNIALSGAYGLGKTSVLNKLAEEFKGRVIKLSLLTLGTEPESARQGASQVPAADTKTNRIQKELVKQLLYQVNPSSAPKSRFHRIRKGRWKAELIPAAIAGVIGAAAALMLDLSGVTSIGLVASTDIPWLHPVVGALAAGVAVAGAVVIARMVLHGRIVIDKITAGPATLALPPRSSTYFDEYLDEIIYFFEVKKKVEIVIIEDLDRFDDPGIFESLRSLNSTLNSAAQLDKRNFRFIYAVKDSIFEKLGRDESASDTDEAQAELVRANRTKFFELVIPVVPFITHKNARDLLNGLLADHRLEIPKELIDIAARHIADMRLLHNVVNEYKVFKHQLLDVPNPVPGLLPQNLFAMVLYKNTLMSDFEKIRLGRSHLDILYSRWRTLAKENTERLRAANRELHEGIEFQSSARDRAERLASQFYSILDTLQTAPGSFISVGALTSISEELRSPETWRNLIEDGEPVVIQGIDRNGNRKQMSLNAAAMGRLLDTELDTREWVARSVPADEERIAANNETLEFLRYHTWEGLCRRPELKSPPPKGSPMSFIEWVRLLMASDLAADLVIHGYITSYYPLHVSTFYGEMIRPAAMSYIIHNIDHGQPDTDYQLNSEDVEAILRDQGRSILTERSMYNISIVDHLLTTDPVDAETVLTNLASAGPEELEFIDAYLAAGQNAVSFVERITPQWLDIFNHLVANPPGDVKKQAEFIEAAIRRRRDRTSYEISDPVRRFIEANYLQLAALTDPNRGRAAGSVIDFFQEASARISSVRGLSSAALEHLRETRAYVITAENLEALSGSSNISLNQLHSALPNDAYQYVFTQPRAYLDAVETSRGTDHAIDTPDLLVDIFHRCQRWPVDAIKRLVANSSGDCVVSDLGNVPEPVWEALVAEQRVSITFGNVFAYFEAKGSIDQPLSSLLSGRNAIAAASEADQEDRAKLAVAIINSGAASGHAQHRIDLALSVSPGELPSSEISPEPGELVGRLIAAGLLADDESAFDSRLLLDWPSYEFAIRSSTNYLDLIGAETLPGKFIEKLMSSDSVRDDVKESALEILDELDGITRAGFQSIGDWALRTKATLSAPKIDAIRAGGAYKTTVFELLSQAGGLIDLEDLRAILRKLGEPFSTIADPGRKRPIFPADYAPQKILQRLKDAGIVSGFRPKGPHHISVSLKQD